MPTNKSLNNKSIGKPAATKKTISASQKNSKSFQDKERLTTTKKINDDLSKKPSTQKVLDNISMNSKSNALNS
jgi:hypothetical protein